MGKNTRPLSSYNQPGSPPSSRGEAINIIKHALRPLTLRQRFYLILVSLVSITLFGGLVMVWYTYQIDGILKDIIEREMVAFEATEDLVTALANQKGFVSYYFVDGDPDWLRQLDEYRLIFKNRLETVRSLTRGPQQQDAVARIEQAYHQYIELKDQVIGYYKAGEREKGAALHRQVRNRFFSILDACEDYKQMHAQSIQSTKQQIHHRAMNLRVFTIAAISVNFILAAVLVLILVRQILQPVARILESIAKDAASEKQNNIVAALGRSVEGLIRDADQTQDELKRSRENLMQSKKMAMVGKLAAGMAHSIRNPFTSVKMRLFTLARSLALTNDQKEDFKVISEEIRHIDTIVQNFLEFSRPPKLKMQRVSPSTVVDHALQLLTYRLKSYNVTVEVVRNTPLPQVYADTEQLKEVLVNLTINACEAMKSGGKIVIREERGGTAESPRAMIYMTDSGPGIPQNIQNKIFEPFFTTKEDGTGLGLSIAARIIQEHKGELTVTSRQGEGATFILSLPVEEMTHGNHNDHR